MARPAMSCILRILHCLRAPVGGLFRHVRDLAEAQAARGHEVGIICDATTGGAAAEAQLAALAATLRLGITRVAMSRQIGFSDLPAYRATRACALRHEVDVIHGHGAKGGAYGRLAARSITARHRAIAAFYTPHGGSLHYEPGTLAGRLFLGLERQLEPATSGLIFESAYSAGVYERKVGKPRCPVRVIHNGLHAWEFAPVTPAPGAADFVFVGELRRLKGVDVLLRALGLVASERPVSAVIVGAGPDEAAFRTLTAALGIAACVRFAGPMPAREAFALGRCLVVPSRAESFPYIVLEAAAAALPMIATGVGGIPEITAGTPVQLIAPGNETALAEAMTSFLQNSANPAATAATLQRAVRKRFTVAGMADAILDFYRSRLPVRCRLTA